MTDRTPTELSDADLDVAGGDYLTITLTNLRSPDGTAAKGKHKEWIPVESMSQPITR